MNNTFFIPPVQRTCSNGDVITSFETHLEHGPSNTGFVEVKTRASNPWLNTIYQLNFRMPLLCDSCVKWQLGSCCVAKRSDVWDHSVSELKIKVVKWSPINLCKIARGNGSNGNKFGWQTYISIESLSLVETTDSVTCNHKKVLSVNWPRPRQSPLNSLMLRSNSYAVSFSHNDAPTVTPAISWTALELFLGK